MTYYVSSGTLNPTYSPLVVVNALARLRILCFIPKILAVKFAVKLGNRRKNVFGPRFLGKWYTPDFKHAFSNQTHFRACARFWLSSVQRAWMVAGKRKKKNRGKT